MNKMLLGVIAVVAVAAPAFPCDLESWVTTSPMNNTHSEGGLIALDGYLYAVGGSGATAVEMAEILPDGSLGPWSYTSSLLVTRADSSVGAYNGYIYVFGGWSAGSPIANCERAQVLLDHTLGPWERTQDLPFPHGDPISVVVDNWVYLTVIGFAANLDELYPGGPANPWVSTALPNIARDNNAAAAVRDNRIYLIGLIYTTAGSIVESTTVVAPGVLDAWTVEPNTLQQQRCVAPVGVIDDCIFVSGGLEPEVPEGTPSLDSVEASRIQPTGEPGPWSYTSSLNQRRSSHGKGVVTWGDYIYAVGGSAARNANHLSTVEYARITCSITPAAAAIPETCASSPVSLDATPTIFTGCADGLEFQWTEGPNVLCPWCASPECEFSPQGDTSCTLETRCSTKTDCTASLDVPVDVVEISPQADAGAACSGGDVSLDATATTADCALEYEWSDSGGALCSWSSDPVCTVPATVGNTYTLSTRCMSPPACTASIDVSPSVYEIHADVSPVGPACRGDAITLDAGLSTGNCPLEFRWLQGPVILRDFGPGPTISTLIGLPTTYTAVVRCAADPFCETSIDLPVQIVQPPAAEAGLNQVVNEGDTVQFDGALTTGAVSGYEWDLAYDGVNFDVDASGAAVSTSYLDDGYSLVALRVAGPCGDVDLDTLVVQTENVAPVVDAGADQDIDVGVPASFSGSFVDPGVLDVHTIEWDFGDGDSDSGVLTTSHTYKTSGIFTVTLTVTDDDGGVGSDALVVNVVSGNQVRRYLPKGNLPPVDAPEDIYEGVVFPWDDPSGLAGESCYFQVLPPADVDVVKVGDTARVSLR